MSLYEDAVAADQRDQYAAFPDTANPLNFGDGHQIFEDAGEIEGLQYVQFNGFCFPFVCTKKILREIGKNYEYIYLPKQFMPVCFGWRKLDEALWIGETNLYHCGGPEEVARALAAGEIHKDFL